MPCYHPQKAFRDSDRIRFVGSKELHNLILACGQCFGCRLERSRQTAMRCIHEAKTHKFNSFVTLTYADEHLPRRYNTGQRDERGLIVYGGTLVKDDCQRFLKRLRKSLGKEWMTNDPWLWSPQAGKAAMGLRPIPRTMRYYMAGEYGDKYRRPHYHLCLFGIDFADKLLHKRTPQGHKLYTSNELNRLWPYGFSTIGELTFETAAYTARYVMKKINGRKRKEHYTVIDQDTGELIELIPEYNDMSRAEGIGKQWLNKYTADVYYSLPGQVVVRNQVSKAPRYYDTKFKLQDPERYEIILDQRKKEGQLHKADQTPERLAVREQVAKAKVKSLTRKL